MIGIIKSGIVMGSSMVGSAFAGGMLAQIINRETSVSLESACIFGATAVAVSVSFASLKFTLKQVQIEVKTHKTSTNDRLDAIEKLVASLPCHNKDHCPKHQHEHN